MSTYNIDFLLAGLILLLLILYHFMMQKKLDSSSTRIFRYFISVGIADVIFDLLCTILVTRNDGSLAGLAKLMLTIFYLLQVFFPLSVVCYANSLRNVAWKKIRRDMAIWAIVPIVMVSVVILNYWSGILFYFDREGMYHQGSAYMLMYHYAFAYTGVVALITILYYHELGTKKVAILWEFLLIEGICTLIQAVTGKYLMTGFGISIGITVFYLTINNPNTYTDQMTGAFGKPYFDNWFADQMEKGKHIHVISIEAQRLRKINKIFGTSVGDQLLIQITEKLEEISRNAKIFRLSGRRFILVMESLADYEACRRNVQHLFQQSFRVRGEVIYFPVVICGIVNGETLKEDTLLAYLEYMVGLVSNREETVLIQSDDKIMEGFLYEQEVERFLDIAIEKDLFEVYYQPVYSIRQNGYVTLEALSRLKHPSLGTIPPDVFITLAEKNGQISRISQLQFRRVCRFIQENEYIMKQIQNIKFNLSPLELLKDGCEERLMEVIREYGLKGSYFQLEITETMATEYSENLSRAAKEFQKAGIGFCLDDFGSGYANLNTVLKLSFSCIKLDCSLLKGACEDTLAARFYQSIVSIFRDMGFWIIAEGAETREQTEMLRDWGVDMIQGYYFSKPVGEKEILELL